MLDRPADHNVALRPDAPAVAEPVLTPADRPRRYELAPGAPGRPPRLPPWKLVGSVSKRGCSSHGGTRIARIWGDRSLLSPSGFPGPKFRWATNEANARAYEFGGILWSTGVTQFRIAASRAHLRFLKPPGIAPIKGTCLSGTQSEDPEAHQCTVSLIPASTDGEPWSWPRWTCFT